ncbi:hypothetical protein I204_00413 [Kwoniella mangroviensis CBS 8886]|nr:uncharacterized protein I203_06703 [Kwoniella mangroviensis CBS 8507]OCF64119.1 hypothetical protein I203_06703 [Kwoniella mangroviensis CBS 8507]OCF78473.1 hypothetical protein I204_00413 [Kwoniella mangroviensis CBS 8886]
MDKTALLIIDVQYDFLPPSGSLAVPDGQDILPVIHDLLDENKYDWPVIVASQDYHPRKHISFASTHPPHKPFEPLLVRDARGTTYQQTLWPDHCIQGTKGTEIEESIKEKLDQWGRKGTHMKLEAYSAFDGDAHPGEQKLPSESPLSTYLRKQGVEKVVIVGLATDFCVLQTALSAISASFDTLILGPAVRGISPEDTDKALVKIRNLGGKVIDQNEDNWETRLERWFNS